MRVPFAALLVCLMTLAGCSSNSKVELLEKSSVQSMYETTQRYLSAGRFSEAAQVLTSMNTRYPFGPFNQQVQLDLIYALYKTGDQDKALSHIDRFMSLNPNHPDLDYVRYMKGLVYQQAEGSIFQDFFNIDRADRSPYYAERAFEEYNELIRLYPESNYVADARARMLSLSSRLARYELTVAEYYLRRGAYIAAANRAKKVVESHPNVPEQSQALEIMYSSYQKLGLDQQASDVKTMINNTKNS